MGIRSWLKRKLGMEAEAKYISSIPAGLAEPVQPEPAQPVVKASKPVVVKAKPAKPAIKKKEGKTMARQKLNKNKVQKVVTIVKAKGNLSKS